MPDSLRPWPASGRAVVDVYEVDGVAYVGVADPNPTPALLLHPGMKYGTSARQMLMASATGPKWEGGEKDRCERTADSFFIGL